MDGPITVFFKLGSSVETLFAVLVGMGFGLSLEGAGFGDANVLVSIFYGRDFRVLRVMFTAVVTAMVGLYLADLVGLMPISSIGILDTYLWAQLVGGLLVGFGFIVGGWCPGTSMVGVVSGKVDALLYGLGVLAGSAIFTLGADSFAPLMNAGAHGRVLLHEWFHVPSGVMVFAVALMAVGAFAGAGRIEAAVRARLASHRPEGGSPTVASGAAAAPERSLP
jgi:uncharacterized membrane protein YedE/YeeE